MAVRFYRPRSFPTLVVPLGKFRGATGLNLGDIAMVVFGDKKAGGIVGDLGPSISAQ